MKIVIDIPEELYEAYKDRPPMLGDVGMDMIAQSIANGTPLPKGHGRIKDIDAFITKVKADRKHSIYLRSWTADDVLNALDNSYAPTIIKADKEGEDADSD